MWRDAIAGFSVVVVVATGGVLHTESGAAAGKLATPTSSVVTVAGFQGSVDPRGQLVRAGIPANGVYFAAGSDGDDVNFWTVYSDSDGANDYVDYVYSLPSAQDWSRVADLQVKYRLTATTGRAAVDVYVHDNSGAYTYLGLLGGGSEAQWAAFDLTRATRSGVDHLLFRVHETHFASIGVDGQSETVRLFELRTMGRFQAWKMGAYTMDHNGVPIQGVMDERLSHQWVYHSNMWSPHEKYVPDRSDAAGGPVVTSSEAGSQWGRSKLIDRNGGTYWASAAHSGPDHREYFELWYNRSTTISWVRLWPRVINGVANGMPENLYVWAWQNNTWQHVHTYPAIDARPSRADTSYVLALPRSVTTTGIRVSTTRLRAGSDGGYYFQLADAETGYTAVAPNYDLLDPHMHPTQTLRQFATDNAGRYITYILMDEPGQAAGIAPDTYARNYHDFVTSIRAMDPTARFSPAGFEMDNNYTYGLHGSDYAEAFRTSYRQQFGTEPPVHQWRFHAIAWVSSVPGGDNLSPWFGAVDKVTAWAQARGYHVAWGSFELHNIASVPVSEARAAELLRQMMQYLAGKSVIDASYYWGYDLGATPLATLANGRYSLTMAGRTYLEVK